MNSGNREVCCFDIFISDVALNIKKKITGMAFTIAFSGFSEREREKLIIISDMFRDSSNPNPMESKNLLILERCFFPVHSQCFLFLSKILGEV